MKTYKNLFEPMLDPEMVRDCALDAAEGKIKRPDVFNFFVHFDRNYEFIIKCANDPDFRPLSCNNHYIIDGANHKERLIEKPNFCPEQVLHHMLIETFKPVLLNGLYEHVYGCLPPSAKMSVKGVIIERKYGPHSAYKQLIKWVRVNDKRYVCETDIHHAYASVYLPKLIAMLKRVIKDDKWINLMCKFLEADANSSEDHDIKKDYGLVLGHYTSPWLFNFYLKEFDHFMASYPDIKYLRFADNMFLVGPNKRKMHKALDDMREYLRSELHLELNKCTQIYRFEYFDKKRNKVRGRAINALGFIIHYNRVTLRKHILRGVRRKATKLNKKENHTWHDASSMLSRLAWTKCTDTYNYFLKYIKPLVRVGRLKKLISKTGKMFNHTSSERRSLINDYLGKSHWLSDGETSGI